MKSVIIQEFKKCYNCGSTDTVAQKGMAPLKAEGKVKKDAFVHLGLQTVNMLTPSLIALTIPKLVTFWDVCLRCGIWRCTRAQRVDVPIKYDIKDNNQSPGAQIGKG